MDANNPNTSAGLQPYSWMKIQSELMGNHKKYRIKSLYDNNLGETNRNIDAVRYENSKNTCEITNAIHAEGEATRALINANTVQELRDRLEARDRDILARDFQLSQLAQNQYLVNTIKPCPIPAYLTTSPYASVNPCGCGTFA